MSRWRHEFVTQDLRYIVRQPTDISAVKMEPKPRTCACGCKKKFTVAIGSGQRWATDHCKESKRDRDELTAKEK